nr:serine hydrolase [Streptococcus equi]
MRLLLSLIAVRFYTKRTPTKTVSVASLSKVLTAYLVYKEVQAGKLKWDSSVTISNYP